MNDQERQKAFLQAKEAIESAQNIVVITHKKPDGDALGSACALSLLLKNKGKNAVIACVDPAPEFLQFLPGLDNLSQNFNPDDFDLIVTVDCGAVYMSKFHEKYGDLFDTSKRKILNIDHHPSNECFGTINIIETSAASTSLILYTWFQFLKVEIKREIATCLLTGIYTDTGSFMHSNTSAEVYKVAAELIKKGANFRQITKSCFRSTPLHTLKLWGKVLKNIKRNEDGVVMSVLTEKDFEECKASPEDTSGVIDLINSIPDSKFSVLLTEDNHGLVKGSFRTQKDDVDLSQIAGIFGGGGHKKAAGFSIPGRLEKEIRWKIIPAAKS